MGPIIDEFIEYLKNVKGAADNTVQSYRRDLEKMAAHMAERGVKSVEDISEDRLMAYAAVLQEEHLKPVTVMRHYTSYKAFFRYLVENGNIQENPAENLKAPKVERKAPKALSLHEVDALLNQDFGSDPKGIRDRAILELLYSTGLKTTELVELKLENIDMSLNCLRFGENRVIPYGSKTKDALNKYLLESRKTFLPDETEEMHVFLSYLGKPMSRQGLWKLIKNYFKKAGIDKDITPNMLRNSFIMHLLENGAESSSVLEMLGFSDKATLSRYTKKAAKPHDPYEWARLRN